MSAKVKLTKAQAHLIETLWAYPNEMIMHNGWLTGGHGIRVNKNTERSLERLGIIIRGKLNPTITKTTENK